MRTSLVKGIPVSVYSGLIHELHPEFVLALFRLNVDRLILVHAYLGLLRICGTLQLISNRVVTTL